MNTPLAALNEWLRHSNRIGYEIAEAMRKAEG